MIISIQVNKKNVTFVLNLISSSWEGKKCENGKKSFSNDLIKKSSDRRHLIRPRLSFSLIWNQRFTMYRFVTVSCWCHQSNITVSRIGFVQYLGGAHLCRCPSCIMHSEPSTANFIGSFAFDDRPFGKITWASTKWGSERVYLLKKCL